MRTSVTRSSGRSSWRSRPNRHSTSCADWSWPSQAVTSAAFYRGMLSTDRDSWGSGERRSRVSCSEAQPRDYDRYAARRDGELADPDARRSVRGTARPLDLFHRRIPGDRHLRDDRWVARRPGLAAGWARPHHRRRPRPPLELEYGALDAGLARTGDVARSRGQLDGIHGGQRRVVRLAGSTAARVPQSAGSRGDARRVGRGRVGRGDRRNRARGVPSRCHPAAIGTARLIAEGHRGYRRLVDASPALGRRCEARQSKPSSFPTVAPPISNETKYAIPGVTVKNEPGMKPTKPEHHHEPYATSHGIAGR